MQASPSMDQKRSQETGLIFSFLFFFFSFLLKSFVEVPYKIETGEAERLAVNHVANLSDSGNPDESKR